YDLHIKQLIIILQAEDGIRDRNVTGVQTCALRSAAEADRTGLAILNVGERESLNARMTIDELLLGADDDAIRDTIVQAGRTGIDVPLGWPQRFVEFVSDHASGHLSAPVTTDRE